jgi:hypothetical protein
MLSSVDVNDGRKLMGGSHGDPLAREARARAEAQ